MDVLRIAICEDSNDDAKGLQSLIMASCVATEISHFESGDAFLASRPAGRFDLVFLDIYMEGISGIEVAYTLRKMDEACGVVFTTTSEDHRPEAFDVDAEQYLVKPVDKVKLEKVLRKRLAVVRNTRETCSVNERGRRVEVVLDHIYYVEVQNHNCLVHTADRVIETGSAMKIDDFELLLPPPRFLRCHKSYIVNMSYVESVGRDFIMKNGQTVYIRRGDIAKCARELDRWRLYEAGKDEA